MNLDMRIKSIIFRVIDAEISRMAPTFYPQMAAEKRRNMYKKSVFI
jgi:hypothetical protein